MTEYSARDAAKLLDLPVWRVRAWARSDVLTPDRNAHGEYRFSFRDLLVLRAARDLGAAQIPPARIRHALKTLRTQLPVDHPLTELRIGSEGNEIVVRDGETAWNPESGQIVLDFRDAEPARSVEPLPQRGEDRAEYPRDASEWCRLGLELEAIEPVAAQDAYRRALELQPDHADALVNLGRLLHEDGNVVEAEACYRRALELRPNDATAAFNLGTALEDLGRPGDAVAAYELAAASDPTMADAYFNLSRVYERLGARAAALRSLRSYKSLIEHR